MNLQVFRLWIERGSRKLDRYRLIEGRKIFWNREFRKSWTWSKDIVQLFFWSWHSVTTYWHLVKWSQEDGLNERHCLQPVYFRLIGNNLVQRSRGSPSSRENLFGLISPRLETNGEWNYGILNDYLRYFLHTFRGECLSFALFMKRTTFVPDNPSQADDLIALWLRQFQSGVCIVCTDRTEGRFYGPGLKGDPEGWRKQRDYVHR